LNRAHDILTAGKSLIIDASFKKKTDRQEALALAHQAQADFLLIECQSDEREIQRRLAIRAGDKNEASDGRWELFANQKEDFEKVEGMGPDSYLPLKTQGSVEKCLGAIFQHLLRRAGRELPRDLNLN
jgi:hypothetical protein